MHTARLLDTKNRMQVGENVIDVRVLNKNNHTTTVLLLHGIGVSSAYYMPFAEILEAHFAVHALDLPGYGETPEPKKALSPAELAKVAALYLDVSGITETIIIGQSMGGQIAARLAASRPDLCSKLILIGPTINNRERTLLKQSLRLAQDTLHEPMNLNFIILRDYLRMGLISYIQTFRLMIGDHLEDYAPSISAPSLIVRGQHDPISTSEWIQTVSKRMPLASTADVGGAPHNAHFANPKELFSVCRDFLLG